MLVMARVMIAMVMRVRRVMIRMMLIRMIELLKDCACDSTHVMVMETKKQLKHFL